MTIVWLLVPLAILMGIGFLTLFIWSAKSGQLEDLVTPAYQILKPEQPTSKESTHDRDQDSTKS